jgi:hypothetical protein
VNGSSEKMQLNFDWLLATLAVAVASSRRPKFLFHHILKRMALTLLCGIEIGI